MVHMPNDVDSYIISSPRDAMVILNKIRRIVRKVAPMAEEKISYKMPYFGCKGRLLYMAAHKDHVGLYIMPAAIRAHKSELKGFKTTTGGVQLPYGKPIPSPLIEKMVKENLRRNEMRAGRKEKKKLRKEKK
jgi:uncharacterized protein YdhG (YjbR/CyaY superfamily)